jgi:predicted TIM-barrel fold metal-dependent hydrolase
MPNFAKRRPVDGGDLVLTDAQVHMWLSDRQVTPDNAHHRRLETFTENDLLSEMDDAGVNRAVVVPHLSDAANDRALAAARAFPDRLAVMRSLDVTDSGATSIVANCRQLGASGLRLSFREHDDRLTKGDSDWVWPIAEAAGLPIMIWAPGRLSILGRIAESYPGLRLIVDHMGCRRQGLAKDPFDHLPELLALAPHPNIAVKATALPCYSRETYPFADVHIPLRSTIDAFGAERIFWGSDLTRLTCSYSACIDLFMHGLPWLSSEDKRLMMGAALCRWIDWPLDSL